MNLTETFLHNLVNVDTISQLSECVPLGDRLLVLDGKVSM